MVEKKDKDLVKQDKDLTKQPSFDLSQFEGSENGATGLEVIDQTDLKLPKIKLVQMTSEEFTKLNIAPGSFYNTVTKESSDKLECIMLALGKSRAMWPATFKRGDKPLCRSYDGLRKTEGMGDGNCIACQYAKWPETGEKPPCTMGYIWLGLDNQNRPFRLPVRGSSVSITKDFLNVVIPQLSRGGKHLGIFVFKLVLTAEKQTNDKGTFYVLKYNIVGTIGKDDYPVLEGMSSSLREIFLTAIDKDNIAVDIDDSGDIIESDESSNQPGGILF